MTYSSHTNVPDALVYSKSETSFGMTVVLCITGGVGMGKMDGIGARDSSHMGRVDTKKQQEKIIYRR